MIPLNPWHTTFSGKKKITNSFILENSTAYNSSNIKYDVLYLYSLNESLSSWWYHTQKSDAQAHICQLMTSKINYRMGAYYKSRGRSNRGITVTYLQGWLQTRSQSPGWQALTQVCFPQGRDSPQAFPQEMPSIWQATLFLNSCFPWHHFSVNAVQGGHRASLWHWCITGCPQGCGRVQVWVQKGGLTPHAIGG